MKKLGFAVGATFLSLSVGCAFFGFNAIPLPTPLPASPGPTPTPTPTAAPTLAPGQSPTPTPDATRVAAGKTVYDAKCATCHAADGKGLGYNLRGMGDPTLSQKMSTRTTMGDWGTLTTQQKSDMAIYLGQLQ
ncbi:MAG: cytochrome c [Candidatus Sericytochromatia bacterium]|nr:cytochrome c [Candidatus Tanganyikabacteria bacterium]